MLVTEECSRQFFSYRTFLMGKNPQKLLYITVYFLSDDMGLIGYRYLIDIFENYDAYPADNLLNEFKIMSIVIFEMQEILENITNSISITLLVSA